MRTGNRIGDSLRRMGEFLEDQWFDGTHHVRTSWDMSLEQAGIVPEQLGDSEAYQPARARHVRKALMDLPLGNVCEYSFIDLGSGKGRTLFVAAAWPFRQVIGVEFSPVLHAEAERNLRHFRSRPGGAQRVMSLQGDAALFLFPEGPLVLYLFNPFGAATTQLVLDRLAASFRREPRHIVLVLLWPQCSPQVAAVPGMCLVGKRPEYEIWEMASPF